ncbi:hypothetical protein HD806DRAFT_318564 [Xylariaceae sp. AK1471]|nr:hypothetical protein HD806DRAFT_318564 [Xylariaceae sp. AK1471]
MTPTQVRRRPWKKATIRRALPSKYLPSPNWIKRPLSLSRKSSYACDGSKSHRQHGHPRQTRGSGIELDPILLSDTDNDTDDDTDDDTPAQDPFSSVSPPSTPQRLLSRPGPSTPWSSKSAPALLELSSTPGSKRKKENGVSPQAVDDKIIKVLTQRLSKKELSKERPGDNYLFEVIPAGDPQKTVVKIGHTVRTEQRRLKEIGTKCGHFSMKQEEDPEGSPIMLYRKAESLMRAELLDLKYRFACTCRTAHREYFEVDKATAQKVIQSWRRFCESDPYDADGNLLPFWVHRLQQRKKLWDKDYCSHRALSEQERRRIRWERFSSPTRFEKLCFDVTYTYAKIWPRRWHAVAFVEAFAIVVITFPSLSAFLGFAIISLCILVGMSGLHFPVSLAFY